MDGCQEEQSGCSKRQSRIKVPSFAWMMHYFMTWGAILLLALASCQPAHRSQNPAATLPWSVDSLLHANHTPTWEEAVDMAAALAASDARATLHEVGVSDVGRPIHALVLTGQPAEASTEREGVNARLKAQSDTVVRVLVNNAIHPGEPCGVNASLALASAWLAQPDHEGHPLRSASWVIVPQYNVGGASRRNCCTRANQNGPEAYGFRGNAANLDLNRDFVKMDSRNAEAFVSLFHDVDPDVFVDTHTSNGADYPYTMTLIATQADKAGPVLGPFLREVMEPALYAGMEAAHGPMVPYVYSLGETPEEGILSFLETPRYSTGYTTLFGTLGFTTEAHMLKPFPDRVQATHAFLEVLSSWIQNHGAEVKDVRRREELRIAQAQTLPVRWQLTDHRDALSFTGYAARREWSAVTQGTRLKYDRSSTWTQDIPHANRYDVTDSASVPQAWILPQAWRRVVERLQANGVNMTAIPRDTTMLLEVTWIESFTSASRPYEGHHPVTVDSIRNELVPVDLYAGDWVIPSNQRAKRYLTEVLSPRGHDAFLVWNFFDAALQRKEYYSSYVFEDTAEDMLRNDENLRTRYTLAQAQHPEWAKNPALALRWLYEQSPHNEGTANRHPVYAVPASTQP